MGFGSVARLVRQLDHNQSYESANLSAPSISKNMKTCSKCKLELPLEMFSPHPRAKDGKRYHCKSCNSEFYRKWKLDNPERAREKWRKASEAYYKKSPETRNLASRARRVGIPPSQVQELLTQQGHRCKICGTHESEASKHRLHIDHCHRTNNVRGMLCSKCNTGIGLFLDNPNLLRKAADYIFNAHKVQRAERLIGNE